MPTLQDLLDLFRQDQGMGGDSPHVNPPPPPVVIPDGPYAPGPAGSPALPFPVAEQGSLDPNAVQPMQTPTGAPPMNQPSPGVFSGARLAYGLLWNSLTGGDTGKYGDQIMKPENRANLEALASMFGGPYKAATAYADAREGIPLRSAQIGEGLETIQRSHQFDTFAGNQADYYETIGQPQQAAQWRALSLGHAAPRMPQNKIMRMPLDANEAAMFMVDPVTGDRTMIGDRFPRGVRSTKQPGQLTPNMIARRGSILTARAAALALPDDQFQQIYGDSTELARDPARLGVLYNQAPGESDEHFQADQEKIRLKLMKPENRPGYGKGPIAPGAAAPIYPKSWADQLRK